MKHEKSETPLSGVSWRLFQTDFFDESLVAIFALALEVV